MQAKPPRARQATPRYFGMTLPQWVILIGLGSLSLSVLCAFAYLLLRSADVGLSTVNTVTPVALPSISPNVSGPTTVGYPTLPPKWTSTPVRSPTATRLRTISTETPSATLVVRGSPIASPTARNSPLTTATSTATQAGQVLYSFAGTTTSQTQTFSLPSGTVTVEWIYTGPNNSEFAVVLGQVSTQHYINFVNGMGPMSGSAEVNVASSADDFFLSVEAFGSWRVNIIRTPSP